MAQAVSSQRQFDRAPQTEIRTRRALWALIAVTLLVAIAAPIVPLKLGLWVFAATLFVVLLVDIARQNSALRRRTGRMATLTSFIHHDPAPLAVTRQDGVIIKLNAAAIHRFKDQTGHRIGKILSDHVANPNALLFRLQNKAQIDGSAHEEIVLKTGHFRLSVQMIDMDFLIWRVEDISDRGRLNRSYGGSLPFLTLGRNGAILSMNEPARRLVGGRAKSLDRVFVDLPYKPGEPNCITTYDGRTDVNVLEIEGQGGRRELYLLPMSQDELAPNVASFYDEMPLPLLKLSAEGKILMCNRPARLLLGVEDCVGLPLSDLMEGLGRSISDWLAEAAAGRGNEHSEFLRFSRTDKDVFVQVSLRRVLDEDQYALIAVLTDATELKTLEAQFVQTQKMQAVGELAGGVAHDFNNLLTAISGHCDLLLLRHDAGDADFSDLVQIHQNANRAASLVRQLLAFSRKQTLRPEVLDVRDTLSDLGHLLNRLVGEKTTLTLRHDPVLQMIRADKRQLEQVLMNLVVNARDAMADGGEIIIETETLVLAKPMERDRAIVPRGAYVSIKVTDFGCGIPQDKVRKVFEPFFTTKKVGEGTGLGLSTAYGIVKQSGGFIFLDSVLGQGTTFTLLFPVHQAPHCGEEAPAIKAPQPSATQRGDGVVLLVEDEAPVRAFASRALKMRGYTVIEAESAEAALAVLEDSTLKVDVFLTDVVMPGMDGPTWVSKALVHRPGVQVIFVSGYAEDSFGDAQSRIPNSVFLPKPFSLTELTETVYRRLN